MPDPVQLIPLAEIDDAALPRDRTGLDPEPMAELRASILASGLRMPVELFPLPIPREPLRWGIVSGFRRIATFRELDGHGIDGYAAIPAFLRQPPDLAATLAAMVEENEIRADLSPYERGRIAMLAAERGIFPTIDAAVDRLYPAADPTKRSRLRSLARLAELLDGSLAAPEKLSLRQALRLAAACQNGFLNLIRTTLEASRPRGHAVQWELLEPILFESERFVTEDPGPEPEPGTSDRRRPRRVLHPRPGLTIRREMTRDGYSLHFTGREVSSALLDLVLDEIERMYAPG